MCLSKNTIVNSSKLQNQYFVMFCISLIFMIFVKFSLVYFSGMGSSDFGFYDVYDNYDLPYYAINYDNGLIVRGLAGELFGNFLLSVGPDFAFVTILIKTAYIIFFAGIVIIAARRCDLSDHNLGMLIMLMFMRPFYLNSAVKYTIKADIFWYACILPVIFLLCFDNKKHFNLKMIVVLLCSTIAMLFHHSFIFIFSPLICAFLIEKKQYKWFAIYGVYMCALFLSLLLFFHGDYDLVKLQVMSNLESSGIWDCIEDNPNLWLLDDGSMAGLYYEYGADRLTQLYESDDLQGMYSEHVVLFFIQMGMSIFSLIYSIRIIHNYCRTVLKSKYLILLIISVFVLPFVALIFFTIDIDRWALMTLTSLNIFSLYLAKKYDIHVNIPAMIFYISFVVQMVVFPFMCFSS